MKNLAITGLMAIALSGCVTGHPEHDRNARPADYRAKHYNEDGKWEQRDNYRYDGRRAYDDDDYRMKHYDRQYYRDKRWPASRGN